MRLPLTAALALALAPAALTVPASPAAAAAAPRIAVPCFDTTKRTWTYLVRPRTCTSYDPTLAEITPVRVTSIRWKRWGTARAIGTGRTKGEFYTGPILVEARALKRCSRTLRIYSRVTMSIPERGAIAQQRNLPCPKR